ncbi:MAG: hypothetical protein J5938_05100 [Clostridia bacterium]|nr:hypothetical protein [Clostridia bacterium]MBO4798219.1 hypothetical protein [Candidatus Methanomethylophilaceae archaeon]
MRYHTFSLIWDESYYRFYLDVTLIAQTDFANGTSSVEEQVLLSLEPCGSYAKEVLERGITEMATDRIRIWQKRNRKNKKGKPTCQNAFSHS